MMRGGWVEPRAIDESMTRADAERVVHRLWVLVQPHRRRILGAVGLLVLQTATLLAGPLLVRYGVDSGVLQGDFGALNLASLLYLGAAIAGLVLGRLVILTVGVTGETFLRDLRTGTFRHLLGLDLGFYEREPTGRLVSRMTADIDVLQELVQMGLIMFVQNVLIFVGAIVVVFILSWQLAIVTLIVVPPVVIASRWFRHASNRAYLEVRDRVGANLATLQEGLAGVRVVQAFGREGSFTDQFEETNEAQFEANLETVRIASRYFPIVEFAGVVGTGLIIGVGGWYVDHSIVTVGTVFAFVLYLNNLFEPVQQLSQLYNTVQQSGAALQKLFELEDTRPAIAQRPGAVDLPDEGEIRIEDVSFAYTDTPVLHDVTLRIEPGERMALVGPTGAGKSTLAKLLARLYDPGAGSIAFDGVELPDATLRSLRERIVLVPQEGFLFAGSIRDNVRIGDPDASDERVDEALRVLGLYDRFASLPDGLDTAVRERGSRLSAGERQLVSLARAALADPALLILDEATSNLDPGTERDVEACMERLMEGRTVVVVAHRLTTAERANRIAVVDDGRLAELGSHAELVVAGGRYARLHASWTAT